MRRNLLLALALFTSLCIGVNAEITTAQQTDPENLYNTGYSETTVDDIQLEKDRALARPYEPAYERKHTKFTQFFRGIYAYIDPSIDTPDRSNHTIRRSPSYRDL